MRISDWSSDVCSSDLTTRPAAQYVRAVPAGQPILAAAANDEIVERIARHRRSDRPGIDELLDIGAERVVTRGGANAVAPFPSRLDHLVAGLIDDIEVVTRAAAQQVVAAPAIEMVVAGSSDQQIVAAASIERVTGQHIVAASDAVGIVGTDHGFEEIGRAHV